METAGGVGEFCSEILNRGGHRSVCPWRASGGPGASWRVRRVIDHRGVSMFGRWMTETQFLNAAALLLGSGQTKKPAMGGLVSVIGEARRSVFPLINIGHWLVNQAGQQACVIR